MSDFLLPTVIIAVLFVGTVFLFVKRGSYANLRKRGGVIATGKILEIHKQNQLIGDVSVIATKIIVEIENKGMIQNYNITTFEKIDLDVGSYIKVLVNFSTGECGLYKDN